MHSNGANVPKLGLIKLLDPDHPLGTPHFQRSYAWTKKEVGEFWTDLKTALDAAGGPADYFMGLIVVDEKRRIQDGQQRLATTLVFLQELYDLAKEVAKNGQPSSGSLLDEVAAVVAPLIREHKPVLVISDPDQTALLKKIGISAGLPESTRRLQDARTQLRDLLEDDISSRGTTAKLSRLASWASMFEQPAYVVELEVPAKAAHKIFETLNTRGLRLKNGDLVKSFLLARARNQRKAEAEWRRIVVSLSDADGDHEATLDDFLYHYYGSKYDKVVSKESLFAAFAKHVEDEDPLDVLETLHESSMLYAGLVDPFRAASLNAYPDDAKYAIQFMNGMRFRQLRYLLLAALRDFPHGVSDEKVRRSKQSELIVKIAGWSVRSLVTGRVGGQVAQSLYVAAAKAIRTGQARDWKDIRKLFIEKRLYVSTRAAFERAFVSWRFDTRQGRALLFELERAELGKHAAISLKGDLTLEHVLPERPTAGTWKDFTGDDRTLYPHLVGNYLLLAQPFNSSLGNLEWGDKKTRIQSEIKSQTPLTVAATAASSWNRNEINRRSRMLAKKASRHWPG